LRWKSQKVSGLVRKYSRFLETIGGDWFDHDCRQTLALGFGPTSGLAAARNLSFRRPRDKAVACTQLIRELLRSYVLVLANSGIRTGEANKLKVTDVHPFKDEKQRHNYRLVVRGKTGERDAILRSVAAKRLDKYLAQRRVANPGGLLFVMPNGSKITSLIDQLNSALKAAGIERSSFGEKYSAYSLRHFYAVSALRNGVGVFEVARNMGTSVQIIQDYYGKQATSAVFATRLGD
jgi:integrase